MYFYTQNYLLEKYFYTFFLTNVESVCKRSFYSCKYFWSERMSPFLSNAFMIIGFHEPFRKKWFVLKSGDLAGHFVGPSGWIHRNEKYRSK